ncbi:MAG: peptide chain release factor 3 [Hyphomicrobiaceae bacterium]|nr:peptide chain release factor 3 [Hyphomicrobiaceae bacterium]
MQRALPTLDTLSPDAREIRRRRTFAIISHPDAGKTTLTEKLLLFGGAIGLAGHVRARGEQRRTRSDWMEIERSRGISVTSSVMTFEYGDVVFNLLDTPGHSDFSEDTYRTLSAVDAAVMVIDAAKGIESQTRKLFEVCRLRDIPIVTFINKVDREAQDPLSIIDEISSGLALDMSPMTWPIGLGSDFRGLLDGVRNRILLPEGDPRTPFGRTVDLPDGIADLTSLPGDAASIDERIAAPALEGFQLAQGALPPFDLQSFHEGHLSPVFFGSALRNFGVDDLLNGLSQWVPGPMPRKATTRTVTADEKEVSGFVFKVQANMDPNHRDRVAFVRLCSGKFRRGMKMYHVREDRQFAITAPILFFAQSRETVDEAYAGDIIGVPNHGTLRVGDTLTEKEKLKFEGIPNFAPELLRRVIVDDAMKMKALQKALDDLAEEGVAQVFHPMIGSRPILGVVGALQLDVLASRLKAEYNLKVTYEAAPCEAARWITADTDAKLQAFVEKTKSWMAKDRDGAMVYLAESTWKLNHTMENNPDIMFSATRERG